MTTRAAASDTTAIPSCRLDGFTATFRTPTAEMYDQVVDYAYQLNSYVDETRPLALRGKSRHFTHMFQGGGLVVVEGTPPLNFDGSKNEARNAGMASITLRGQFFSAVDAVERAEFLIQTGSLPGFYHCTRLDAQVTVVEPQVDAAWVIDEVAAGRLWAFGYRTQRVYGSKGIDGRYVSGCTQYFGSATSDRQARTYDKAAESGWSTPAVRHEVQLRDDKAAQRFVQLKSMLLRQRDRAPLLMTAEQDFVKTLLSSELDYRDLSKWEGKSRPKDWAKAAPKPGWWLEVTGNAVDTFEYAKRPKADLDQAFETFLDQYGRKWALKALKEAVNGEELAPEVAMDFFWRAVLRTKDGDASLVHQELAGVELGAIQERLTAWQAAAARYAEQGSVLRADGLGLDL